MEIHGPAAELEKLKEKFEGKATFYTLDERAVRRDYNDVKAAQAYKADSVKAAWDNHFSAFGAQDVDKILLDYDDKSVLKAFNHTDGKLESCTGLAEIKQFFENLFKVLSDTSGLAAPVIEPTEDPAQTYLIWSCPTSGIVSATDTFIFDESFIVRRQNIAYTTGDPAAAAEAPAGDQ